MFSSLVGARTWLFGRSKSFGFALHGLFLLFLESNAKIHFAATLAAVLGGLCARISGVEWALVVFAIGAVWAAEAINTAIELLADAAVPERHPLVGAAKDVAASAVLIAAISAAVVGAIVFLPRLAG
jgi:diacylglycerol kinase (ATP)